MLGRKRLCDGYTRALALLGQASIQDLFLAMGARKVPIWIVGSLHSLMHNSYFQPTDDGSVGPMNNSYFQPMDEGSVGPMDNSYFQPMDEGSVGPMDNECKLLGE